MPDALAWTGESAERWRAVRKVLTVHRYELGRVAARLYPEVPRVASADVLCREEWVPARPLGLDELALRWDGDAAGRDAVALGAARYAEASRGVRPLLPEGGRYASYTEAVAALDRPELFEDRPCYRLLEARLTAPAGLRLGETSYFDGIDLGHAVAHELTAAWEHARERSGRSAMRTASPQRSQAAASSCATAWPRSIPSK